MKKIVFGVMLCASSVAAYAHTDLLNENFSGTWTNTFNVLNLDGQATASAISAFFMGSDGVSQPWWPLKDSANGDRFLGSHSYYQTPGQSNDWLVSGPLDVASKGFVLSFDAQSLPIRPGMDHALSDLWVFVTEQPATAQWQPTEPVMKIDQVPMGNDRDNCENDFTNYTLSLDDWAGKTVYISFANLNDDKDILCLDNILVRRNDVAELTVTADRYVPAGDFEVSVAMTATAAPGLGNWCLRFTCGEVTDAVTGGDLAEGAVKTHTFTGKIGSAADETYTVTLSSDNNPNIVVSGEVTGMAFEPEKRLMIEETTGVWCGNCPMAMYTLENLEKMPEYEGKILPVSIHVGNDPMGVELYEYMFGIGSVAPMMRVNREDNLIGVSAGLDLAFDPAKGNTAAAAILKSLDKPALADVTVEGEYLYNGETLTGVEATVDFTPAVNMNGAELAIGFVLTENNVYNPKVSQAWMQHNYVAGSAEAKAAGNEWGFLPEVVPYVRFQDVARQIYDFHGGENTLPARELKAGETVSYNVSLPLPVIPENLIQMNPDNLYLTAFVIDRASPVYEMVNSARTALGDNPENKFTAKDLCDALGIEVGVDDVFEDVGSEPEYYSLEGLRVAHPSAGIYLVKKGNKVTKQIIR